MTPEQLNEYVETVDIAELNAASVDKAAINICGVYSKARPVLEFISNFWLLPEKWRAIVKALTAVLDGLCPQ